MPQLPYRNLLTVSILGALATFSPFSLDLSSMRLLLPDFPHGGLDLHAPAAKTALAVYGLGMVAGQPLFAPVLGRFGTGKPFYLGLAVFILSSLGGLALRGPETQVAIRVLQALGGLAAQAASMTMARDFFSGKREACKFSLLILLLGAASTLLPAVGGSLFAGLGWQWGFILTAASLLLALEFSSYRAARKNKVADEPRAGTPPERPGILLPKGVPCGC